MRAKLTFNLLDPDEKFEFKTAVKSTEMAIALREFSEHVLRQMRKYDDTLTTEQREMVEKIEEEFHRVLADNGVNLDDII